jgi:translation initiation factor 2 beta subunit (eIF-2beta)/eIF-5
MTNEANFLQTYTYDKKSSSLIEELEDQLHETLKRKKRKVEEELQEKIRLEQEEARNRIDQIEGELTDEQGTLANYKNIISQFEADRENIKTEIKKHVERAIQMQSEIEEKTRMSLQEMEIVSELSKSIDEINQVFGDKLNSFSSTLKDKYGIKNLVSESKGQDDLDINLEKELAKLIEIKNLLKGTEKAGSDI